MRGVIFSDILPLTVAHNTIPEFQHFYKWDILDIFVLVTQIEDIVVPQHIGIVLVTFLTITQFETNSLPPINEAQTPYLGTTRVVDHCCRQVQVSNMPEHRLLQALPWSQASLTRAFSSLFCFSFYFVFILFIFPFFPLRRRTSHLSLFLSL